MCRYRWWYEDVPTVSIRLRILKHEASTVGERIVLVPTVSIRLRILKRVRMLGNSSRYCGSDRLDPLEDTETVVPRPDEPVATVPTVSIRLRILKLVAQEMNGKTYWCSDRLDPLEDTETRRRAGP